MRKATVMGVIEGIRPDLVRELKRRAKRGESLDVIARWLSDTVGQPISREMVRLYLGSKK